MNLEERLKNYKNMTLMEPHGVELRIISSEKPCASARHVEASLEDVFLYYFGEKAGDEDAAV